MVPIVHPPARSDKIEDQASGVVTDLDKNLNDYGTSSDELEVFQRHVVPILCSLRDVKEIPGAGGVSERTVKNARAGRFTGKTKRAAEARRKLARYACELAIKPLFKLGLVRTPRLDSLNETMNIETLLCTYIDTMKLERLCAGCQDKPARPRSEYYSLRLLPMARIAPRAVPT